MAIFKSIYQRMRPHSQKPFPESFYENFKIKPRHVFVFDVLCRHLDQEEDGWIWTDSKRIVELVKIHNGLRIEVVTTLLLMLKEYGYIDLVYNDGFRSVSERVGTKTLYQIRILESAWAPKPRVIAPLMDPEIRKARYYARRAAGLR